VPNATWVVPGAPLPNGEGWRIWYSTPGDVDTRPSPVRVELGGQPQATVPDEWQALPPVEKLDRRAGVLTVRLQNPRPGSTYTVTVPEAGRFAWRTLPADLREEVVFLASSCFYRETDGGSYRASVVDLTKKLRPAFKLLMGDQVYADWPRLKGRT